jgi:hypothetical protein
MDGQGKGDQTRTDEWRWLRERGKRRMDGHSLRASEEADSMYNKGRRVR